MVREAVLQLPGQEAGTPQVANVAAGGGSRTLPAKPPAWRAWRPTPLPTPSLKCRNSWGKLWLAQQAPLYSGKRPSLGMGTD